MTRANADEPVVLPAPSDAAGEKEYIRLHDLMHGKIPFIGTYPDPKQELIQDYRDRLTAYQFSIVTMSEAPIEVATEVCTRINITGRELSLFEIMTAKNFDTQRNFDLAEKYEELRERLDQAQYGTLAPTITLQAIAAWAAHDISRKAIFSISKDRFIDAWPPVVKAFERAIDYMVQGIGVPVSQLLPYPVLLNPFTYYFYKSPRNPNAYTKRLLEEFFGECPWANAMGTRLTHGLLTI